MHDAINLEYLIEQLSKFMIYDDTLVKERNRNDLKISLFELRNLIDIKKKNWINTRTTNCYAYALGLDIPQSDIRNFAYVPGVMSNSKVFLPDKPIFTYDVLFNNLLSDLDALKIEYREIDPLEEICDDEWKIALFVSKYLEYLTDFHFLRQHNDGIWYQKNGYIGGINNFDSNGRIITNPEECQFKHRTYTKCYSLRLKR